MMEDSLMNKHLLELGVTPSSNIIRSNFSVRDTSSKREDCGIFSLEDLLGEACVARITYKLPTGRLSEDQLADVCCRHQVALLVISVFYSPTMEVDNDGNVLIDGYGLSLFVPSDDVCDFRVLLNESGHFSPVTNTNDVMLLPIDIIRVLRDATGSNYNAVSGKSGIYSDFNGPAMKLTCKLRTTFNLWGDI